MPIDKQKLQKAQQRMQQSLTMIASHRANIEHHLPDLQNDLSSLEGTANMMAEEIGQLREVFNGLCVTRYHVLLPDSGVDFEKKFAEVGKA